MSLEDEVKALASGAAHRGNSGRMGMSVNEAKVHYELEAIWDALLLLARRVDTGS